MRTKDVLARFEDIKLLHQYLYMDDTHFIEIINAIGVHLRLRMDDQGRILCQNMNFPDVPETNWSENMTIPTTLAIIDQLDTEMPAIEFPKRFHNRWDEIKTICQANLALNFQKI